VIFLNHHFQLTALTQQPCPVFGIAHKRTVQIHSGRPQNIRSKKSTNKSAENRKAKDLSKNIKGKKECIL